MGFYVDVFGLSERIVIFYVGFSNMRDATARTAQPLRKAEAKPHEATLLYYFSFFSKRDK